MTSGQLIREARLRAGITQQELADRLSRTLSQVNRWENDGAEPGLTALLRILRACGFDLALELVPFTEDPALAADIQKRLLLTPSERMLDLLNRIRPDGD